MTAMPFDPPDPLRCASKRLPPSTDDPAMTSVLHSVLRPMGNVQVYPHAPAEGVSCARAPGLGGLGAAETPRGGSIGRRGAADEIEGPSHVRESKNLDPLDGLDSLDAPDRVDVAGRSLGSFPVRGGNEGTTGALRGLITPNPDWGHL